jgi:hypothetical protein
MSDLMRVTMYFAALPSRIIQFAQQTSPFTYERTRRPVAALFVL